MAPAAENLLHELWIKVSSTPDAHAVVGYPKFDIADLDRRSSERVFADDRPVLS